MTKCWNTLHMTRKEYDRKRSLCAICVRDKSIKIVHMYSCTVCICLFYLIFVHWPMFMLLIKTTLAKQNNNKRRYVSVYVMNWISDWVFVRFVYFKKFISVVKWKFPSQLILYLFLSCYFYFLLYFVYTQTPSFNTLFIWLNEFFFKKKYECHLSCVSKEISFCWLHFCTDTI